MNEPDAMKHLDLPSWDERWAPVPGHMQNWIGVEVKRDLGDRFLDTKDRFMREIEEWLVETCKWTYHVDDPVFDRSVRSNVLYVRVFFRSKQDAALFKMFWMDW